MTITIILGLAIILCAAVFGKYIKIAAGLAIAAGIFYLAYQGVSVLVPDISWTAIFWIAVMIVVYGLLKVA